MLKKNLLIAICLLSLAPSSLAASPGRTLPGTSAAPDEFGLDSEKNLKILENRFFFHDYNHDPIEKRLERLELLIVGGVQSGNNKFRLDKLKAMVQQRDSQAAKDLQARTKELKESKDHKDAGASIADSQYPVLNTLEWRALKKTYKGESLDKRLERLETNLFGVPAVSMSYADRVDRLKKVIGIEQIQVNNSGKLSHPKIGPQPRAEGQLPLDLRRMPMDGRSIVIEQFSQQFPNSMPGPEFKDLAESTMRFRKIFDQMQRMMEMLPGMGTGAPSELPPGFMQSFPFPLAPEKEMQTLPKNRESRGLILPNNSIEPEQGSIPPYIDPNSI